MCLHSFLWHRKQHIRLATLYYSIDTTFVYALSTLCVSCSTIAEDCLQTGNRASAVDHCCSHSILALSLYMPIMLNNGHCELYFSPRHQRSCSLLNISKLTSTIEHACWQHTHGCTSFCKQGSRPCFERHNCRMRSWWYRMIWGSWVCSFWRKHMGDSTRAAQLL